VGKRELLAKVLYRSGLWHSLSRLNPNSLVVLNYHRIRPNHPTEPCLLDEEVFGPTQDTFESQMKWLKSNFQVLSESELLEVVANPEFFEGHLAAVTFDDGYRDNYDLAFPVLSAHAVPAMFFVCPALIDERRLGWWDLIAYLVKQSERASVSLRGEVIPLGEHKPAAIRKFTGWMKQLPAAETVNLPEKLAEACGVQFPDQSFCDRQLMTWEQIRAVRLHQIAIGSHTQTHRVLATLPEEGQRWEMTESKTALEAQLGAPVRTLAYPVGGYENFTTLTMRLARDCGYAGAFSFHSGINLPGDGNPFNLRRIAPADHFDALFACGAALPQAFSWSHPLPASHRELSA